MYKQWRIYKWSMGTRTHSEPNNDHILDSDWSEKSFDLIIMFIILIKYEVIF